MKRRGLLVPVLLLIALLLVTCLAQLTRQPEQYKTSLAELGRVQARALALAGLDDFVCKWRHDLEFPPPPALGSTAFTYLEPMTDSVDGSQVGTARVTIDYRYQGPPYYLLKVTGEGLLGSLDAPRARFQVDATLDICTDARPGRAVSLGQWIEWKEWAP